MRSFSTPVSRRTFTVAMLLGCTAVAHAQQGRWTEAQAHEWYKKQPWLVGANYVPANAINELEMWQAESFDPKQIDKELGWAAAIGMNTMRVFLHDALWRQDSTGFLRRIDQFLAIADRHRIRPMFVLFDAVWDPFPKPGPQRAPVPHLHNSGWVQSPGVDILRDTTRHERLLKGYVQGVVRRFARDRRVLAWDVFNEPDNINRPAYFVFEPRDKAALSLALLRDAFAWARAVGPTQPLTAGPWKGDWLDEASMPPITRWMLEHSDVITFHSYDPPETVERLVAALARYERPILCTEYMARPRGSTFQAVLPKLRALGVGAYNWGFVAGDSQTIYPWDSWTREYTAEPPVWFHDIFRVDGTPYVPAEVELIRSLTGRRPDGTSPR